MSKNLNELLKLLLRSDLDFVIIGGFAGVIYGATRVTKDLDIVIAMSAPEIRKLQKTLAPYHPQFRMNPKQELSFLDPELNLTALKNIYLETDLGILDVIGDVLGVGDFIAVSRKSRSFEVFGQSCKVIGLEDLIASKKALGRECDLLDVKELEAILTKSRSSQ